MNEINKKLKHYYLPIGLILILSLSRVIPHPWNFPPVLATGIFAGYYFRQFFLGLFIVIFSMFLGDILLGFHVTMFFTYISLFVAVFLGLFIKYLKYTDILWSGLVSSISFFIITNFGVWQATDIYDKSLDGLMTCYIAAIPFFANTILSTFFYLILIKFLLKSFAKQVKTV